MCDLSDVDGPPTCCTHLIKQLVMQASRLSQLGHKIQPHVILELESVKWNLSSVLYNWGGRRGGHEQGAQVHGQERLRKIEFQFSHIF